MTQRNVARTKKPPGEESERLISFMRVYLLVTIIVRVAAS